MVTSHFVAIPAPSTFSPPQVGAPGYLPAPLPDVSAAGSAVPGLCRQKAFVSFRAASSSLGRDQIFCEEAAG